MKTIYTIILILFISIQSFSQVQIQWQRCYGGSVNDESMSCIQTKDGGYVIAGLVYSNDGDVTGNHGSQDFWVVKLDETGVIQWQKCLGGIESEYACSTKQTFDEGYIVVGPTRSNDGDVSGNHGWQEDYWVVKLNSSGNIEWQKCFGGTNGDYAYSVTQSRDSGYFVTGIVNSNDGDVTLNHGIQDIWVLKIDSIGNLIWQKSYGGSGYEWSNTIELTNDGGCVISGGTTSNDGDVSGNHGGYDFWIIKIDDLGNLQWQKCIGGSGDESMGSVIQTLDGGYVLAGRTESTDGDVSNSHGLSDILIVRLDSVGNMIWNKCFGGSSFEYTYSLTKNNNGGYVISGGTSSNDGDIYGNHGAYDIFLLQINDYGSFQWQKCFGGTSSEVALSICNTGDRGYAVLCYSSSTDGDITYNNGQRDFWFVKLIPDNISGQVFHDINLNGIKDTGEQGVVGHLVKLMPGPFYTFTNNNGNYYFAADTGQHSVSYVMQAYWVTTNTQNYQIYVDSVAQVIDTLDFGVISKINTPDVAVYITGSSVSTNRPPHYWLTYKNWGTTTASGTINFTYDPILTYNNSTQIPASQTGNTIVWNYDTLGPGAQRIIRADFDIPGIQYLGDTIYSSAWISPLTPDSNITNNYDSLRQIITGPVDPNDKVVTPVGKDAAGYVLHGQKLNYTIHFQNTGNDTAITVVIRDTLSLFMNIETFSVDASSHPVTWELLNNHEIVFRFQNILLPDSNENEPLSHGFVRYSISPMAGLSDFKQVENTSYIFFDYNPAVITNTTINTYVSSLTSVSQSDNEKPTVKIYPNPSQDRFLINLPEFTNKVQVCSMQGELLQSFVPDKPVAEINLKDQPAGVYLVKMQTLNGVVSVKIVKK